MNGSVLPAVTRMLSDTQLQLEATGYPAGLVRMGIERARGMAASKAQGIRPELYGSAFQDILALELSTVENWLVRQLAFVEGSDED